MLSITPYIHVQLLFIVCIIEIRNIVYCNKIICICTFSHFMQNFIVSGFVRCKSDLDHEPFININIMLTL